MNNCIVCGFALDAPGMAKVEPDAKYIGDQYLVNTGMKCERCWDKEIDAAAQKLQEKLGLEFMRSIPPAYINTDKDKLPAAAKSKLDSVLSWNYGPTGLLLYGPPRSGKTRLMVMLIRSLTIRPLIACKVFFGNSFAHECGSRFGMDASDGQAWIQSLVDAPLVFFDDLAKGKFTERVQSELFHIVEMRAANYRPTMITTNSVGHDLAELFAGDRAAAFVERLREFCTCIEIA